MKKIRQYLALALCFLALCSCAQQNVQSDDVAEPQTSGQTGTVAPVQPSEVAEPTEPSEPAGNETPEQTEQSVAPDEPAQPTEAQNTEAPSDPDKPSEPETQGQSSQPENQEPAQTDEPAVTISIRCDTVLDNLDSLAAGIEQVIPSDGVILAETELALTDGESVFDLLSRATRDNGVHMEYSNTPIYQSAYIEGIGNLYELDCGPLSGWMYRVNGVFPNYGCSKYAAQDGDVIEWVYTCDLGSDIGGADAFAGQKE